MAMNVITKDGLLYFKQKITAKNDTDLAKKADVNSVPTKVSQLTNDSGFQTANQVSTSIGAAINGVTSMKYEIVSTLPSTGAAGTIYLKSNGGTTPNVYDEYIWVNNAMEKIGTTAVDLSNYVTMSALNTKLFDYINTSGLTSALASYAKTADYVAITNEEIDAMFA